MNLSSIAVRLPGGALLSLCLFGLALAPAVQGEELTREQQILALEQQISELQKKLEALKKAPAPAPKSPSLPEPTLPTDWVKSFSWRSIGPASMGGRIVALSVFEADPSTYWVATASGGLLKTTNNGVTFEHQFDRENTVSVGDVCVAPSDRNIVWVGTGENNPRNSVSYGDGVYKSTDGGKTWKNMGLTRSFQIGKILIHPTNPDIVYVGALGRLYGPNEERGLFKTTDGGKTWQKILYIDDKTGIIDMRMHPTQPDTLLVAAWERQRDGFDSHAGALAGGFFGTAPENLNPPLADGYDAYDPIKKWGKGSGIYKTTDGGKTFKKLTAGLPSNAMGRIGLDFYRKNPNTVFAIIDCEKIGTGRVPGYLGITSEDDKGGAKIASVTDDSPASQAGLKVGDLITAVDGKPIKDAAALSSSIQARTVGDKLSLAVQRESKPVTLTATLAERPEGGPAGPGRVGGAAGGRRTLLDFKAEDVAGGVRVQAVLPSGPSATAGLQVGDVIVALEKEKITSFKQITDAYRNLKPGAKVNLTVQRDKQNKQLAIVLPEQASQRRTSRPYAFNYGGQRENVQNVQGPDGQETGGVYRSDDAGETWKRINSVNPRPMYFSQVRVDPSDDRYLYVLGIRLYRSEDGGKTFRPGGDSGVHPDHHALWINPRDGRHLIIGTDGGTYVSYDRCAKWDYLNTMALGQFYHVTVDSRKPYRVYGGLQDNGSWGGPSMSLDGRGLINADWVLVQGGDGFVCRVDPVDPDIVYTSSQEGNMTRTNIRTGERAFLKPQAPRGQPPYRFNWNTPFIVSSHNPQTFYCAGNYVFRSIKRGSEPRPISPELTKSSQASATALAESPRNAEVLWAGTDDGQLWLTRNGGASWENLTAKTGLPRPYWIATIEPSRFVEGRCYVCFDAHRSDDDQPYLLVTEDFGQTWRSIRSNLPVGSSRVLREDLFNGDVLYVGTEFAVWASIDRGTSWTKINNNLPTVAVHELAQHPTAGEIVAATHGRSLWIADISALRQLKPAMRKETTLLAPNTVTRWRRELPRATIYGVGNREFFGQDPQAGTAIYYTLGAKAKSLELIVQDITGKSLVSLPVKNEPGLHRVPWDLRSSALRGVNLGSLITGSALGRMARGAAVVPAGSYRVVLKVDGKEQIQTLKVENDPVIAAQSLLADEEERPQKKYLQED